MPETFHIEKQPAEVIVIGVDFSSIVGSATISSTSVTSIEVDTGQGASIAQSAGVENNVVKIKLSGGTDGKRYKVTVQVTLSDGQIWEEDVFVDVVDI